MKKSVCFMLILFFAHPLVFAKGGGDRSRKQAPNRIVIYTSMYQDVVETVRKDLQRQFPKYDIHFVQGGTGIIQAKVNAEQASGRLGCDILMVAEPAYSLELKEKKMLHPFKSKEAANLAFEYDPEGYWYPVRVSNMVLAYNPERNSRSAVPDSFYDFAHDSRVAGALSVRNPLISGTAMATATALRDKYGYAYYEALGGQRVKVDYGADDTIGKLESGECKVVMILEESILRKRQHDGSKLEVIYPTDGAVMIPSTIMIVNNDWSANRNTKAAEQIAEWFLSEEGQHTIVDAWMHSVRKNFPRLPFDAKPTEEIRANSIPVIWDNVFRQRAEIYRGFEEYIAARRN